MLATMQLCNRKCRRSRSCAFNDYVISTIEQEPLVNPVQEQRFLAIDWIWHHKEFYEALTEGFTLTDIDLPPSVEAAVKK